MAQIKRMEIDAHNWYLVDPISKARYRERPFENYSELPYYKYEIQTETLFCVFSLNRKKDNNYDIGAFSARPLNEDDAFDDSKFYKWRSGEPYGWLKWEPKIAAFEETRPLLKKFLTHLNEEGSGGAMLHLADECDLQTFTEDQLDHIKLHLGGDAHFSLLVIHIICSAFGVDNIAAVKTEAKRREAAGIALPEATDGGLWFDFDDWMEESQEESYRKNLEDLKRNWLMPDTPIDALYEDLFEHYLPGGGVLPEQDDYVDKHLSAFQPFLRSAR